MFKTVGVFYVLIVSTISFAEFAQDIIENDFLDYKQSTIFYYNTNIDSAELYLDSALTAAYEMDDPYYVGQALQLKSRHHFLKSESDSALKYCEKSTFSRNRNAVDTVIHDPAKIPHNSTRIAWNCDSVEFWLR